MSEPRFTAAALRGAVDLSALKRPAPRPGAAGAAAAPGATGSSGGPSGDAGALVVTATDATFQDVAAASMRWPVVVVLWSGRAPESASFVGVLGEVARSNAGRFQVASIDVDSNPNSAAAMGVRGIPSLFIFKDGQVVSNKTGAAPKAALKGWIDESI